MRDDANNPPAPMCGRDLVITSDRFGLPPLDMQWLLGKSDITSLYRMRRERDKPINTIVGALILRFLNENPGEMPLPPLDDIQAFYDLCTSIDRDFSVRDLGVLLGRDGAAGYRWLREPEGKVMRVETYRWMMLVRRFLEGASSERERAKRLDTIKAVVTTEASARGYDLSALTDSKVWRKKRKHKRG